MRVLLDHCVPRPFRRHLPGHEVFHTSQLGWGDLSNGRLLDAAEEGGFEAFITIDQGLRYEQNLSERRLAIVVLQSPSNDIPTLVPMAGLVMLALESATPAATTLVKHPHPPQKGQR